MTELHFEAHDTQLQVLMAPQRFLVLSCGRRWGKDHESAIKIISHSFSHASPRGNKLYAYLNPVYNPQGKDCFRIFCELAQSGGLLQKKIETPPMEAHLSNGDVVKFFSLDKADNLRGGQYDGIVVNEAGLIPNLQEIWETVIQAMLMDRMGWCWFQGTPKGKNAFYRFFLRGQDQSSHPDWASFRFPTHTNPFLPVEELKRIERETPHDMFAQEYLGEFLDGAGTVFRGLGKLKLLSEGWTLQPQADFCRIGLDVARHTDFTVLMAYDAQSRLVGMDRFNQLDWDHQEQRIVNFLQRYRGKMKMDTSGAGDPLFDRLMKRGIPVEAAVFTNAAKTQWVQNLMLLIEDGVPRIPLPGLTSDPAKDTTQLWNELEAYSYDITSFGKLRYTAPPGVHDDCVTAMFLALSMTPPMSALTAVPEMLPLDLDNFRDVGEVYGNRYDDRSLGISVLDPNSAFDRSTFHG